MRSKPKGLFITTVMTIHIATMLLLSASISLQVFADTAVAEIQDSHVNATDNKSPVTVWIDAPDEIQQGETFVVKVNIGEVTDFDVAQYDITYNAAILEVTGITNGRIDGNLIPVDAWGFIPFGVQGDARVINNIVGVPGVSGSGYLAEVEFRAIASSREGSSIDFIKGIGEVPGELILGNKFAKEILSNWVGDSVNIRPNPSNSSSELIPSPSSELAPTSISWWVLGAIMVGTFVVATTVAIPAIRRTAKRIL